MWFWHVEWKLSSREKKFCEQNLSWIPKQKRRQEICGSLLSKVYSILCNCWKSTAKIRILLKKLNFLALHSFTLLVAYLYLYWHFNWKHLQLHDCWMFILVQTYICLKLNFRIWKELSTNHATSTFSLSWFPLMRDGKP